MAEQADAVGELRRHLVPVPADMPDLPGCQPQPEQDIGEKKGTEQYSKHE
jgi:hypothetical protein